MKIYSKQTEEITLCVEEKTMLKKLSTHMLRQSSNRQYSSLARSSLSEAVLKSKTTTGRVTIYSTNPTRNVSYLPNSPVVVISYNDLVADNDISESLDKAFGKEVRVCNV